MDVRTDVPPLLGHPLLTRVTRIGRRLRRADRDHPWLLDTAVVAVIVLLFGVTEFVHPDGGGPGGDPPPIMFVQLPVAATLALQAGLVLPLLWRRRAPDAGFPVIAAGFVVPWGLGALPRG